MAGKKRKDEEDFSEEENSLSEPTSITIGKPLQTAQATKAEVKSEEKAASAQASNPSTPQSGGSTGKGIDDNTLAFVAYILTWITGLIVFLIAKDSAKDLKFVKFHAMQAIFLGAVAVVCTMTIIGIFFAPLIWLYGLYIGFVYAYKGQKYYVPVIGEYAERYSQQ